MKKRIVSLFMALVMTLSLLPSAWAAELTVPQEDTSSTVEPSAQEAPAAAAEAMPAAEQDAEAELTEDNSFLLLAANNVNVIIAPERVPYTEGQTVQQALLALEDREEDPHTFTGLDIKYITAIDGVGGTYFRSDDKGGYDLQQSAGEVKAFLFLTAYEKLDEETATALYRLGQVMLVWQEAEKPQLQKFAQQEYDAAAKGLTVKKTVEELDTLAKALTERMEAYAQYENAEMVPLLLFFRGLDGQPLTEYTFTALDPYGNEKRFTETDDAVALAPGEYTFTLTSGDNGASGTMTVAEDGSVSVAEETLDALRLPNGVSWIGQPVLRSVSGGSAAENAYPIESDGHTVLVPDTVGGKVGLYLYAVPGTDLDEQYRWENSEVRVCAVYTDINGQQVDMRRKWLSTQQILADVINSGDQGGDVRLEARAAVDGYTMYQAWELTLERTPTLSGLRVTAGGVDQKLDFSGSRTEYTCAVTTENVVLRPACIGSYTVTVNGAPLADDGTYTLALDADTTTARITVAMDSGRTNTYTLTVARKAAIPLTVKHDRDVTVRIYNAAGAEIGANDDGTYPLTPGDDSYAYIATKNTYYHTKGTFAAPKDGDTALTITAVTPETEDRLTSLKLAADYNTGGDVYLDGSQFKADMHEYDAQIDDVYNRVYVWATAADCTIRVLCTDGTEKSITSGSPNSEYANCVNAGPESGCVTLYVSRQDTERNVTFEQDYLVNFTKVLTVDDASLTADGQPTLIYQMDEGKVTDSDYFDSEVYDYHATILATTQEASLTVTLPFAGYGVTADGSDYYPQMDPETGETPDTVTIPLTLDKEKEQTVTFSACTESGQKAHTYTLTLKKGEPVDSTVTVVDENGATIPGALAAVYDERGNTRVWPEEDGTFRLVEGLSYTCVATCAGYVGQTVGFIAGGKNASVTVTLPAAPAVTHGEGVSAKWPSFRGNDDSNGVVNAKTPIDREKAVLSWANKLGEGYGSGAVSCPILIKEGDLEFLIVYSGTTLYKVESVTGTVVATGTMCDTSSFAITSATYGEADGMLFVALSNGVVQAFDAATLQSLWIYQDPLGGQPNCPLTYYNGYVYTGFWNQEKLDANFVCLTATDEDPSSTNEEKLARWTYTSKGGFYWAGAYVCADYLLVGTDDGTDSCTSPTAALLCLDPATGAVLARWDGLEGDIRSSIARYDANGRFYFTSKGGYLYSAAVEWTADGWAITQQRTCRLSNGTGGTPMSTCTPVLYNGRAYIGVSGSSQFGEYSGHNITVVDLDSLQVAYSVPTKGYPQTSGLLTTAYTQEDSSAYVYFFDNFTPGVLRMLKDKPGDDRAQMTTSESTTSQGTAQTVNAAYALFTPAGQQAEYAICSPIADDYGTLYFKNDSAYVMALTSTVKDIKVTAQPVKTEYTAGETFDPTGMKITVYYDNGTSRTLPVSTTVNDVRVDYFTYNTTVTETDNGDFFLTFAPLEYQSAADGTADSVSAKVSVNITVKPGEYPRGDVNGDGTVDVYDLQYLYESCAGLAKLSNAAILRGDVNKDGYTDVRDIQALYRFLTVGDWDASGGAHTITVKTSSAPKTAEVRQGEAYELPMSNVFSACDDVSYTLSGTNLGTQTKLAKGTNGWYLSFLHPEMGTYSLTITAVCGADETITASYTLTVTVVQGSDGDKQQYSYEETDKESVTVYVTISNDGVPIKGIDGTVLAHRAITVPYFDLEAQGFGDYYRYHTENGRGSYVDDDVVERPTALHLYLYLLGIYCQGYTPEQVTRGEEIILGSECLYQYSDLLGETTEADFSNRTLRISGGATSMYMLNFWGHDENLMYYRNHMYPLMSPGWGSTADYILLSDGDTIDLAMFTDREFYKQGAFASFDQDAYKVAAGEALTFSTQKCDTRPVSAGGGGAIQPITGLKVSVYNSSWKEVYQISEEGPEYEYIFTTPGTYYLLAMDPSAGGSDACIAPATARVTVTAAS